MTYPNDTSSDELTDSIILSNALVQQIERYENRKTAAQTMLLCSKPVLFEIGFTGIMGERVAMRGISFDQLSDKLQEMLRTELINYIAISSEAKKLSWSVQLQAVRNRISSLRSMANTDQ
jgi:hypothetical protein